MKIYTRGGDAGETSLFTGKRVKKDEARIEALGSLDELVAALGLAKAAPGADRTIRQRLEDLQARIYLVMSDIAGDASDTSRLPADAAQQLEAWIDDLEEDLPELKDFVIPGASEASAALHLARTICRRAERRVVSVSAERALPAIIPAYLNRMSDLLFTMARWVDRDAPEGGRTFKQR